MRLFSTLLSLLIIASAPASPSPSRAQCWLVISVLPAAASSLPIAKKHTKDHWSKWVGKAFKPLWTSHSPTHQPTVSLSTSFPVVQAKRVVRVIKRSHKTSFAKPKHALFAMDDDLAYPTLSPTAETPRPTPIPPTPLPMVDFDTIPVAPTLSPTIYHRGGEWDDDADSKRNETQCPEVKDSICGASSLGQSCINCG